MFATCTGWPLDESYVRKLIRCLALKAGLPQAGSIHPHVLKHNAVAHALAQPKAKLHVVQDFADHKDPRTTRRYDRRRGNLAGSPGYALGSAMAELLDDDEDALFGVGP